MRAKSSVLIACVVTLCAGCAGQRAFVKNGMAPLKIGVRFDGETLALENATGKDLHKVTLDIGLLLPDLGEWSRDKFTVEVWESGTELTTGKTVLYRATKADVSGWCLEGRIRGKASGLDVVAAP